MTFPHNLFAPHVDRRPTRQNSMALFHERHCGHFNSSDCGFGHRRQQVLSEPALALVSVLALPFPVWLGATDLTYPSLSVLTCQI